MHVDRTPERIGLARTESRDEGVSLPAAELRGLFALREKTKELEPLMGSFLTAWVTTAGFVRLNSAEPLATPKACSILANAMAYALTKAGFRVDLFTVKPLDAEAFGTVDHEFLMIHDAAQNPFFVDASYLQFLVRWGLNSLPVDKIAVFNARGVAGYATALAQKDPRMYEGLLTIWGHKDPQPEQVESHENFIFRRMVLRGQHRQDVLNAFDPHELKFFQLVDQFGWL